MILHCSCTKCGFSPGNVGTQSWLYFLMGFPSVHESTYLMGSAAQRLLAWGGGAQSSRLKSVSWLCSAHVCFCLHSKLVPAEFLKCSSPLEWSLVSRGRDDGNLLLLDPNQEKVRTKMMSETSDTAVLKHIGCKSQQPEDVFCSKIN